MAEYTQSELLNTVLNTVHRPGNERAKTIVKRIVTDLFKAIDELDVQPEEFWATVKWMNRVGAGGEFGLVTAGLGFDRLLDIRMDEAEQAKGLASGTQRAIEGPLYIADAPLTEGEARLDTDADDGKVLFVEGTVRDAHGKPIAGAIVDVWHANSQGGYSHFDDAQQPYNLRRRIRTDAQGNYRYRTLLPSGYGVPAHFATAEMLELLGRHGERPAHIHYMVYADGYRTLTTQINIPGDTYIDDDYAFATRDGLIVELEQHANAADIVAQELTEPFYTSRFDVVLLRD